MLLGRAKGQEVRRALRLPVRALREIGQIVRVLLVSSGIIWTVTHYLVIWNTNTGRLAARHCETMFWAGDVFAPKCTIDGMPVNNYLQDHWVAAYGQ